MYIPYLTALYPPRSNRLLSSYRHRYVIFAMHEMYNKTQFCSPSGFSFYIYKCVVL
jgi:hypothetical protein